MLLKFVIYINPESLDISLIFVKPSRIEAEP